MVGSASVKLGLSSGDSILAHVNFKEAIEKSRYGNPHLTRAPSPDMTLISSKIESGDLNAPLEKLIQNQFELSVLLLIVIIIIIILMIYIFIVNKSKNKVYNAKEINYTPTKFSTNISTKTSSNISTTTPASSIPNPKDYDINYMKENSNNYKNNLQDNEIGPQRLIYIRAPFQPCPAPCEKVEEVIVKFNPLSSRILFKKLKYLFCNLFTLNYELNKRFVLGLLIINYFFLIFLLLLNIYVNYELMINIEEYVEEYIYLYNK
jgi:hypothetical protein